MRTFSAAFLAVLTIVLMTVTPSRSASSSNETSEAEAHLRKACEIVWANANKHQIDRCTQRAMAAMGDENRLRDNELKRLLMSSERELEACKQELTRAVGAHAGVTAARHEPDPR